jgi:type I restriction enzyme S subunit
MMPEGWVKTKLRDLGEIKAGRQRSPHFTEGKLRPYLRVANIFDGYIDTSDVLEMYFTDEEYEIYRLQISDILLNEGQSLELVGRPAMYEGKPAECCFQNTLIRFRAGSSIDPMFALLLFQYYLYSNSFAAIALQTTSVAHLGVSRFANLDALLPPLPEQRRIADILGTWDRAIRLTEQRIAAQQQRKRALMQHLLTGRRRFREFAGSEWREYTLGELFTERRETGRTDLPLLSITNSSGVVPRDTLERRDTSNEDKSKYLRLCKGDIGYNTMRMWQGVSAVSDLEGIVSPAYTICIPCDKVDINFMGYLFKYPPIIHLFWRYSQGLVDDTLSLKFPNFAKIRITIPERQEQQRIAAVLQAADNEMALLAARRAALQRQKHGLMQQLLTGRVRVPLPEPHTKGAHDGSNPPLP